MSAAAATLRRDRKFQVTFSPEGEGVAVSTETTILEAANRAGVDLTSPCGGDSLCGKCRVIVRQGNVTAQPTSLLSREEIRCGYVLACQTAVTGDAEIEIPPESRAEAAQILIDLDAQRFRALHPAADAIEVRPAALTRKLYLELPPATLDDSLSDQSRLFREIRRRQPAPIMQLGLQVLKALPRILREADWKVTVTLGWRGGTKEVLQVEPGDTSGRNLGLSVDVGTSTVVAHLIDLDTTEKLDAEAVYNSQRSWGDTVTRRIIHAATPGGLDELQKAVVDDINGMILALAERNHIRQHDITAVTCSGNTTMTHLLLGVDPGSIRKNPYVAPSTDPPPVRAVEVGIRIHPRGLLYTVPNIGGWVGGDITAGILAAGLMRTERVQMLIDIGTNGEIAIGNSDWAIACSASAGPAFEGSGVRHGMKAMHGAIERVEISPEGTVHYRTVGNTRPRGICGSGLIDLVADMHKVGFIDRSGRLMPGTTQRMRERDGALEFVLVLASRSETGQDIVITQRDLTNLLSAKAAIYAGTQVLARAIGLDFNTVDRVLIAGGFGNYLDRGKAIAIGLIPDLPQEKIRFAGNTSILGSDLGLLSKEAWEELHQIAKSVTYYDLINFPDYYDEFLAARFLPHTDLTRFPSVKEPQGAGVGS
ncbi:MAG: ASKHA domain-containing protein [Dehalococcoidia bacterium]